jgi:hypothetical protein
MMRRVTMMPMVWSLSTAGAVVLLASLGAGCGPDDDDDVNPGGTSHDGGSTSDARGSSDAQGSSDGRSQTSDGGSTADGMSSKDAQSSSDGGDLIDGSDAADAGRDAQRGDAASTLAVDLGTAGNYVILAKSAVSTVPTSAVTGNIGLSPAAATFITGFSLTMDSTNVFSTSPQVTGMLYAADYAVPTPSNLTTAVGDMMTAFTDAAGRAPDFTALGAGNIGGKTLTPGVYKWSTALIIPTDVTLTGSATDVWIMQIGQTLTVSDATEVHLTGGALPKNVFWQVGGSVALGTTSHFEGVILGKTAITLDTGASINGRLLAQTAVSIDDSAVVQPAD